MKSLLKIVKKVKDNLPGVVGVKKTLNPGDAATFFTQ
jgi:hypothetical protein